jgi:hypothetical protein
MIESGIEYKIFPDRIRDGPQIPDGISARVAECRRFCYGRSINAQQRSTSHQGEAATHSIPITCVLQNSTQFNKCWNLVRDQGVGGFKGRAPSVKLRPATPSRKRAGFEPSVQFCRAKPRHIRKLQIADLTREFHTTIRHKSFAISPVSIRRPFGDERRTPGDSVAKSGRFARPHAARLGSHVTACLACSHKTESFSVGKNYLRRGFLIIFDFYTRAFSAVVAPLPTSRLLARNSFRRACDSGGTVGKC